MKKPVIISLLMLVAWMEFGFHTCQADELIVNGNFETLGSGVPGWVTGSSIGGFYPYQHTNVVQHDATTGVVVVAPGNSLGGYNGQSFIYQNITTVPRDAIGTLTFYYEWYCQTVVFGSTLYFIANLGSLEVAREQGSGPGFQPTPTPGWTQKTIANIDLKNYYGSNLQLIFRAYDDIVNDTTYVLIDDVSLDIITATKTITPTITPTRTVTRTPTPIPLVAAFTVSTSSGKWPLTVQVTDQSSGGVTSWNWDFGDGSAHATVKNPPAHVYNKAGTYTITLKVTNAKSQSQTATRQITVLSRIGEPVTTIGPFGGFWGDWHSVEMCPTGKLAYGFDVRVEGQQGGGDDTALNGIRLTCGLNGIPTSEITSGQGGWGSWRGIRSCPTGEYLTGARMNIEGKQGSGDDTAADNVAFRCTGGSELVISHDAMWGVWTNLLMCPVDTAICGIQTRVEGSQGSGDDTALNDAKFTCCYSR